MTKDYMTRQRVLYSSLASLGVSLGLVGAVGYSKIEPNKLDWLLATLGIGTAISALNTSLAYKSLDLTLNDLEDVNAQVAVDKAYQAASTLQVTPEYLGLSWLLRLSKRLSILGADSTESTLLTYKVLQGTTASTYYFSENPIANSFSEGYMVLKDCPNALLDHILDHDASVCWKSLDNALGRTDSLGYIFILDRPDGSYNYDSRDAIISLGTELTDSSSLYIDDLAREVVLDQTSLVWKAVKATWDTTYTTPMVLRHGTKYYPVRL